MAQRLPGMKPIIPTKPVLERPVLQQERPVLQQAGSSANVADETTTRLSELFESMNKGKAEQLDFATTGDMIEVYSRTTNEAVKRDIREVANRLLRTFRSQALHDAAMLAAVTPLAAFPDASIVTSLISHLYDEINKDIQRSWLFLELEMVLGLILPKHISVDNLTRIMRQILERIDNLHHASSELEDKAALLGVLARVLDVFAEKKDKSGSATMAEHDKMRVKSALDKLEKTENAPISYYYNIWFARQLVPHNKKL